MNYVTRRRNDGDASLAELDMNSAVQGCSEQVTN